MAPLASICMKVSITFTLKTNRSQSTDGLVAETTICSSGGVNIDTYTQTQSLGASWASVSFQGHMDSHSTFSTLFAAFYDRMIYTWWWCWCLRQMLIVCHQPFVIHLPETQVSGTWKKLNHVGCTSVSLLSTTSWAANGSFLFAVHTSESHQSSH